MTFHSNIIIEWNIHQTKKTTQCAKEDFSWFPPTVHRRINDNCNRCALQFTVIDSHRQQQKPKKTTIFVSERCKFFPWIHGITFLWLLKTNHACKFLTKILVRKEEKNRKKSWDLDSDFGPRIPRPADRVREQIPPVWDNWTGEDQGKKSMIGLSRHILKSIHISTIFLWLNKIIIQGQLFQNLRNF